MPTADRDTQPRGLLNRLGFGSARRDAEQAPAVVPRDPDVEDRQIRRRRQLLADISSFIITHRLDVTPFTLRAAYEVIAGTNERLSERVGERVAVRDPITVEWLEEVLGNDADAQGPANLRELVEELENTMGAFARTASDARTATTQYNSALEQHAQGLDTGDKTEAGEQIARVVRDVLAHTRTLESELNRSEREIHKLENRLADARREAEIDYLTGLPNRRAFEMVYAREVSLAEEKGEPICVAFCDIDHFKRVNDEHGHEAGDRVLRHVAETLSSISDERCHVARHGGEEFGAVLRGRTLEQAQAILDEVRAKMAQRRLINRATDLPFGQITFSAGVAQVRAYSEARKALRAADDALYEAKRTGRNRVVMASSIAA